MISVVIPGYNAEKTVEACLESFVDQTDQDFEILFVDDGSTDRTASIVETFQGRLNLKLLRKQNGGLCSAVSYGIPFAQGDYLVSIDSDDAVKEDFVEVVKREATGFDALEYGFDVVSSKGKLGERSQTISLYRGETEMREVLKNLYFKDHSFSTFQIFSVYRWAIAVKTSIVKECRGEYERWNFGMYEDLVYKFLVLAKAKSAKVIPYRGVDYYQRKNTHSRAASLRFDSLISLREKLRAFLDEYCAKNRLPPDLFSTMEFDVSKFYLSRVVKKSSYREAKRFFQKLRKDSLYRREMKKVNLKGEPFLRKAYFFFLKHDLFLFIFWSFKFIQKKEV